MFSSSRFPAALVLGLAALSSVCAPSSLPARRQDTEEELLARIEHEQNPVKRAKYEIRLGRVKLTQAIAAYDKEDVDHCNTLLGVYLERMKDAWQTLRHTGRNAVKRSEGFRELDIALREDARLIQDLKHRIPYGDRGQVTKVAEDVDRIHNEVIQALFPPEEPDRRERHPAGASLIHPFEASAWKRSLSLAPLPSSPAGAPRPQTRKDVLTDDEEDKLREEQDPSKRIELYLFFAQERLNRFVNFRSQPADPKYDAGEYLDRLLGEYIAVDDELKDWIEHQYDRKGDMRRGLRVLLEHGPQQLEQLRQIQQTPDAFASDYKTSLRDAIEDLTDTLDGATKALADQEKKFGELKKEAKAETQASKERQKEEKKRTKEEKKLQKRERKHRVPEDTDED
jgi:hypothetical protein